LENTTYFATDLFWNPWKNVTLGGEYLWGRSENKDGASGTNNRILFSSRFDY
jgi:nucleoside-specific outer membrane channel protein Tsx